MPSTTKHEPFAHHRLWAYLLALLIGLAFSHYMVPLDRAFALHSADQTFDADRAQHVIGQRYFIADAWRWPLLMVRTLDWPPGVNIALTDSIPILALPAKLLRGLLPPHFHAVLLWIAIAYLAQPVAAVFALRGAGERRLIPALAAAVIAISLPSFLYRYGHAALSGHFLILLALGSYFRTVAGSRAAAWAGPLVLLPASLLAHPYLMVMVAALLAAAPLTLLLRGLQTHWRHAASGLLAGLLLLGLTAWLLGYGGNTPAEGFGIYAMDLLSPFRPEGSALWPGAGPVVGATSEGYQYLGIGLLLLLIAAACAQARPMAVRPPGHWGLVLAAVALTALAVSTRVRIGDEVIFTLRHPPHILNQLRSGGRMFWPVAYAIMIGAIALVMARFPRPVAAAILAVAALLQFADATRLRTAVHDAIAADPPWKIDVATLKPLFAAHDSLVIWPPFGCGNAVIDDPAFIESLLLGSLTTIRTNTMYVARQVAQADCNALPHVAGPLAPGELRLFLAQAAAGAPSIVPDGERLCRQAGTIAVCSLRPMPGLPPIAPPAVPLDRVLTIGDAVADAALGVGWGSVEPEGIWTDGGAAAISLRRPAPGALHLTVWARAYAPRPPHLQQVTVSIDGARAATWSVGRGDLTPYELDIPPGAGERLTLRLDIAEPLRPMDVEHIPDTRALGFFLHSYRITAAP